MRDIEAALAAPVGAGPAAAWGPEAGPAAALRRPMTADVAEYTVALRVGPGLHDVIGLHRVAREIAPHVPAPAAHAVLLVHGDIWGFRDAFLASGPGSSRSAVAVFLAERGVDVWGLDLGWTRVPAGTTDFGFMADWGFARDMRDLGVALGIARAARCLGGQAAGPMHLLGWSRGGQLGYAYLIAESQRPAAQRHVGAFIPVDVFFKAGDQALCKGARERHRAAMSRIEDGHYANDAGVLLAQLGALALSDPGGPSPMPTFPGCTNAQVAELVGGATHLLIQPPPVPFYHFMATRPEPDGGFAHTQRERWFDFLSKARPYQPWRTIADAEAIAGDAPQAEGPPCDDRLDRITVPVLYVAAGGGYGRAGAHSITLLGSSDVSSHIVSFHPEEQRALDPGHADIFHADAAADLFWNPIAEWILARPPTEGGGRAG